MTFFISLFITTARHESREQWFYCLNILFGEFDNFKDWNATVERVEQKKEDIIHKEVTPEELNDLD